MDEGKLDRSWSTLPNENGTGRESILFPGFTLQRAKFVKKLSFYAGERIEINSVTGQLPVFGSPSLR